MLIFPIWFQRFFEIRGCIFDIKLDQNRMENIIRPPRSHFHLLFYWKSNLGLSWKHLGGILGRLGKFFGPSWAPKTPPRCAKLNQNRPQEPPQRRLQGVPEGSGRSLVTKGSAQELPRTLQTSILVPADLDFGGVFDGFWQDVWWIKSTCSAIFLSFCSLDFK